MDSFFLQVQALLSFFLSWAIDFIFSRSLVWLKNFTLTHDQASIKFIGPVWHMKKSVKWIQFFFAKKCIYFLITYASMKILLKISQYISRGYNKTCEKYLSMTQFCLKRKMSWYLQNEYNNPCKKYSTFTPNNASA